MDLPEQSQIDAVIEVIDFWVPVLREYTDYAQLLEGCSRAIGDVAHVLAAEKYGWRVQKPTRYLTSRNEN